MKRTKTLLSLVLAMMMVFSTMSVSIAAYDENEGVMPLYEVADCPECGKNARVTRTLEYNVDFSRDDCPYFPFDHLHYAESAYEVRTACMYCSYVDYHNTYYGEICPWQN